MAGNQFASRGNDHLHFPQLFDGFFSVVFPLRHFFPLLAQDTNILPGPFFGGQVSPLPRQ